MKHPTLITIPSQVEKRPPQAPTQFFPFETSFMSADADGVSIGVSEASLLLKTPSTASTVPIAKLGFEFDGFTNSSLVWLSTFFDSNLQPVFSIVEMGDYWTVTTKGVRLHPDCIDMISKDDLADRKKIVDGHYAKMGSYQKAATDAVSARLSNGYITSAEASTQTAAINTKYEDLSNSLRTYAAELTETGFFKEPYASGTVSGSGALKQISLYTPIAYGTSSVVNFYGSKSVSTASSQFNLQPIVKTDLMLVSIFYKDLWPAKIAMPYHAGKYPTL